MFSRIVLVLIALAVIVPAGAGSAQTSATWDPAQLQVTRAELTTLLEKFETAAGSDAYSRELRQRARLEADLVRNRLTEGDFQVGDQISLHVEDEEGLSNIFVVSPGRVLKLPVIGDVPLEGVLRSELNEHIAGHLGRFIRSPVVRTQSLIRISVTGNVSKPGFYVVPTDRIMTDALMAAGGPAGNADLKNLLIERGDRKIWQGELLQQAITEGRTLDQMSLRAGDRIVVPAQQARANPLRTVLMTATGPLLYLLMRLL
jgi:protein involved in polysaccharide export with SLBB domain